jgi:hypothetical protein
MLVSHSAAAGTLLAFSAAKILGMSLHQAIMAPNGPVAIPNVRGSEKMPEPTIDPTTIAVSANSESFWVDGDALI